MRIAPCKDCNKRHATCHVTCEKYIQWRKEKDIENELKKKKWSDDINYTPTRRKRMWKK